MPTPSIARPPESASSVATRLATTTGLCSVRTRTLVPSRTVLVDAARNASHSSGSGITVSGLPGIRPLSEYGYRGSYSCATSTCSTPHTDSTPASSQTAPNPVTQSGSTIESRVNRGRTPSFMALSCRPMSTASGLPVVDLDGHVFEPDSLWEEHLDRGFLDRRPRLVEDERGTTRYLLDR